MVSLDIFLPLASYIRRGMVPSFDTQLSLSPSPSGSRKELPLV